ncbi:DegT/DnrJ/EryC1/StrS aminotransferase [Candidatus Scalindua japonica]|uniref:DegT/DnrJ/EryC1/StrS aminotransferase n=1 Tax=Candidatus Scalindua japonica TaxID=1284222 RepID=A0A286TZC7_9BACT|nr:DegT/DnrJ/EryC1/StrS family aminotransferase [Candidatus Scalindua japonica]GAX61253.1 DegT/DnrJ/EryC1/StrS aminotransferase [Candidatus Scalindua japonica]
MNKIPFIDLITPHLELKEEFLAVFNKALSTGGFIGGPMVENFEKDFAAFCNAKYCVGLNSGTDALRFSLIAAGVNDGDIVITVPNTFIATSEAITQAGALPAFVDINESTYNIDIEKLREYLETKCCFDNKTHRLLNAKTRQPVTAIIPVHLYGQIADMDPILQIAETYNLVVIEDACQAHGAQYKSKKTENWEVAGSMGLVSAFSFYPGKNLGAFGDAGAVTTDNEEIAGKIRQLRDHGQTKKYHHEIEGYNGRLDAIQAGILQIKLRHMSEWNEKRQQLANGYNELLSEIDSIKTPHEPEWSKAVYHLYVIRTKSREELQHHLSENNIATGLHYPVPLHLQKAYEKLGYKKGDFPVSEETASEILSLPMYPQLTHDQQIQVAEKIKEFFPHAKTI